MTGAETNIMEADLVAYADGRLEAPRLAEVEAWLESHPDDRRKVDGWRMQTTMLRAAFDPIATEPVPAALKVALTPRAPHRAPWIGPALAACLMLLAGFGGGWYVGQFGLGSPFAGSGANGGELVARAGYRAHRLYTAENRHAVEVNANEADHLNAWLSNRIEAPLKAPDLADEGLAFLGGRLVPIDGKPAAQFMYETAGGDRYTLFAARAEGAASTALEFEDWDNIGCFYWIENGVAYALNGPNDRKKLMTIATEIYGQLS